MAPRGWIGEHHAYLTLMLRLSSRGEFDVVHNNSLHYLPIAMAETLPMPVVTTLHTPPTPWLESAIQAADPCPVSFVAVSAHTADAWRHAVPHPRTVHNGIDVDLWRPGRGGGTLAWAGRFVPEKGAPYAIRAARLAGRPLRLAGPIPEPDYFDAEVAPLLGGDIEYVGHLRDAELATLFGESSATLVTPCWDEPYGLVVAESLACGTPVCGFARGALPELITAECGRLVPGGDAHALAASVDAAVGLSRERARAHAVAHHSHEAMVDAYERLYQELIA
jgi:glycosyltransferase involved in cell wall biosynthesis